MFDLFVLIDQKELYFLKKLLGPSPVAIGQEQAPTCELGQRQAAAVPGLVGLAEGKATLQEGFLKDARCKDLR